MENVHTDANDVSAKEQSLSKDTNGATVYKHVCGYCGSTAPLISYEEMYGPGAVGYDCCPDCGGV